jgi:hypothetical protein
MNTDTVWSQKEFSRVDLHSQRSDYREVSMDCNQALFSIRGRNSSTQFLSSCSCASGERSSDIMTSSPSSFEAHFRKRSSTICIPSSVISGETSSSGCLVSAPPKSSSSSALRLASYGADEFRRTVQNQAAHLDHILGEISQLCNMNTKALIRYA